MIDISYIREKILDLAIRGKLVDQDPAEGDAKELLAEIQAEKEELIKTKKIKKEKPLPAIKEEEIPFEIPESWVWVRLGDVYWNFGQTKPSRKFNYIDITSVDKCSNSLIEDNVLEIEPEDAPSRARKIIMHNSVIFSSVRPYLKNVAVINMENPEEYIASTAFIVMDTFIHPHFLKFLLVSKYFINETIRMSTGSSYPAINGSNFKLLTIPLPPLEEQERIVAKIEKAFGLLNEIEKAQNNLIDLGGILKAKVLDLAIQGELVDQDPAEGDARELLADIKVEKKNLIKVKKIRKDNPLAEISEYEIPFDIPESWVWVRLGEVMSLNLRNTIDDNETISFIPMALASDGFSNSYQEEERIWKEVKKGYTHFTRDDILVAKITPSFENRKSVILNNLTKQYGAGSTEFHVIRPHLNSLTKYIYWYINSRYFIENGENNMTGTVGQRRVPKNILEESLLPLPPLAEQKRIVAKIEEIFAAIDAISI